MTLFWFLVGLSLGLAAAGAVWRTMLLRCDLHDYRKADAIAPVEPVIDHITAEHSLVEIYDEATHHRRLHEVWRDNATDLTRDLSAARRQLARLRRPYAPHRFTYGTHRAQRITARRETGR